MIRPVDIQRDAGAIARIYNYYVTETTITYEFDPLSEEQMRGRIADVVQGGRGMPCFVCESEGVVAGYCYAGAWRTRPAYRHTVETSIYLDKEYTRRGLGRELYDVLLKALRGLDIHAVIASIGLPNPQSVILHERLGFQKTAHFSEVGQKFGKWLDVGFWQLNF